MAGGSGPITRSSLMPKNHFTPPGFAFYKLPNTLKCYGPSLALWGVSGFLFTAYMFDWKYVLRHVPYIAGRYK